MRRALFAPLLVLSLGACVARATGPTLPHDRHSTTPDELDDARAHNVGNVYDFLSTRHPDWISPVAGTVGRQAAIAPVVYLDAFRVGGLSQLRSINLEHVVRIRFLTAPEAEGEFGPNHLGGAIVIYTRET